ncbi:hypothetical protein LINPERHAP2_LOCUS7468, partial [Linum perenne]
SLFRCSVEFGGVAGWSCEVKIRKLLWSDHCFNLRFQLTLLGWEICNHFRFGFGFRFLCNEGLRLSL